MDPQPTPGGNYIVRRRSARMARRAGGAYLWFHDQAARVLLGFLLAGGVLSPVRAEERPVTNKVHKKEQQLESELKTERDRPAKKERAKAAAGRVEDGVREFGRGLQGVMKEAGIPDGPPAKKAEGKPAPAPTKKPVKPAKPTAPAK